MFKGLSDPAPDAKGRKEGVERDTREEERRRQGREGKVVV